MRLGSALEMCVLSGYQGPSLPEIVKVGGSSGDCTLLRGM